MDVFLSWFFTLMAGVCIGAGILTPGFNVFYIAGIGGMFCSAKYAGVV